MRESKSSVITEGKMLWLARYGVSLIDPVKFEPYFCRELNNDTWRERSAMFLTPERNIFSFEYIATHSILEIFQFSTMSEEHPQFSTEGICQKILHKNEQNMVTENKMQWLARYGALLVDPAIHQPYLGKELLDDEEKNTPKMFMMPDRLYISFKYVAKHTIFELRDALNHTSPSIRHIY